MNTRRVPAAAAWLLKVFRVTANNPALIGDIHEEFLNGHSSIWLWKQVLAAIVFSIGKELYRHKLLTIRAILTGQVAVMLCSSALNVALRDHWLLIAVLSQFPSSLWILNYVFRILYFVPAAIAFMAGGWIVSRFHAEHRRALVPLFAIVQIILLLSVGELHRVIVDSITQPRFRWYLWNQSPLLILCPLAVLAGGYLGRRRAGRRAE